MVVVLGSVFTKAEKLLVANGRFAQVRESREALHDLMEGSLCEVVEGAVERRGAIGDRRHRQGKT